MKTYIYIIMFRSYVTLQNSHHCAKLQIKATVPSNSNIFGHFLFHKLSACWVRHVRRIPVQRILVQVKRIHWVHYKSSLVYCLWRISYIRSGGNFFLLLLNPLMSILPFLPTLY